MTNPNTIQVPANLLEAVAVAQAQATEDPRRYLCGVHFEAGAMVATDGYLLTAAQIDYAGPSLILPISKKAHAAARGKQAAYVTYDPAARVLQVLKYDESVIHMEPAVPIDGTFPAWRRILHGWKLEISAEIRKARAEGRPDPATFGPRWLSPAMVARIAETARYIAPTGSVCIEGLPTGPQLVRYASAAVEHAIYSIAMPMRAPEGAVTDATGLDWTAEGAQSAAA